MIPADQNKDKLDSYRDRLTNFSNNFELGLFIHLLRKSLFVYFLIFTLSIVLAFLYIRYNHPIFESSLIMQIQKKDQASELLNVYSQFDDNAQLKSEVELLRSELLLDRAIKELPIEIGYFTEGEILTNDTYKSSTYKIDNFICYDSSIIGRKYFISKSSENKYILTDEQGNKIHSTEFSNNGRILNDHFNCTFSIINQESFDKTILENKIFFVLNDLHSLALSIKKDLDVDIENFEANTVKIKFKHVNPKLAKDVVDQLAKEYNRYIFNRKNTSSKNIVQFIESQKDSVEKRLKESEQLIQVFQRQNDVQSSLGLSNSIFSQIEKLEEDIIKLEIEDAILDQIFKNLEQYKGVPDIYEIIPILVGRKFDNSIQSLITDLKEKVDQRNILLQTVTHDNTKINEVENQINLQVKIILQAITITRNQTKEKLDLLKSKVKIHETQLYTLPEKELELARLNRVLNINNKYYTLLLEKETEYKLSSAGLTTHNEILEDAKLATEPISPNKKMTYALGIILAIALSSLFAMIRYMMHDQITSLNEIIKISHASIGILGIVPKYKSKIPVSQLIVNKNPKSLITEAFRSIRTNLQFVANDNISRTIAITSTISGEGKTFVALNLAGIIAFSGKKVVVIDLDMRKPKIHVGFGVDNIKGMSTLLIEKDTIENCILHSEQDGLDFITAGPIPPNPSELIINGKLDIIVDELKKTYDMVIIDNPPVGLVTDGIPIIQKADYPLYIFKANYSKKNFIQNVDRLINENNVPKLSVILNGVDMETRGYGYNYGYGYGYGYGGGTYGGYYTDEGVTSEKSIFKRIFSRKKN